MRVERAFMALSVVWCDVEKYYLKWLRILNCVSGLGFESYVCMLYVIWFIIIFLIYLWIGGDIIIIEL